MKRKEIKEAALNLFINNGYEATSTALIAKAVHLKKQSLYSHFKNKDEIFLMIINETKDNIIDYYTTFFSYKYDDYFKCLNDFLLSIVSNYNSNPQFKFWIRMSFYPPEHLYEIVQHEVNEIFVKLTNKLVIIFDTMINENIIPKQNTEILVAIYSSFINSLVVELVYGNEKNLNIFLNNVIPFFKKSILLNDCEDTDINV